jgi:Putative Ig domain
MDMKIKWSALTGYKPTGQVGRHYRTQLKVKDGTPPYHWELVGPNALPSGLTLDVQTGIIWGIPSQEGHFRLTVMVTDKERATAQRVIRLSIWPEKPPLTA